MYLHISLHIFTLLAMHELMKEFPNSDWLHELRIVVSLIDLKAGAEFGTRLAKRLAWL